MNYKIIALLAIFFAGFSFISSAKNYSVVAMEPARTKLPRGNFEHLIKITVDERLTSASKYRLLENDNFGIGSICAKKNQIIFQKQIEHDKPKYSVENAAFQTSNNPHSAWTSLDRLADFKHASQFQISEDLKKLVFIAGKPFFIPNNPDPFDSDALYVYDLASTTCTEIVDFHNTCEYPDFSPDGKWLAYYHYLQIQFASNFPPEKRGIELCIVPSTGGPIKVISTMDDSRIGAGIGPRFFPPRWSPDGERILFVAFNFSEDKNNLNPRSAIWLADLNRTAPPEMLVDKAGNPSWSPDGKQFCYTQDSTLKIMDLKNRQSRNLISSRGISNCLWCPEGDLIAFTELSGGRMLSFISTDGKHQLPAVSDISGDYPIFWVH